MERGSLLGAVAGRLTNTCRGIRSSPWLQLAGVSAVAAAMLLVGLAVLAVLNVNRLTERWGRGLHVVAYLSPEAPEARVGALERLLREREEVAAVRLVSSAQAQRLLRESLGAGGAGQVFAELEEGLLPRSLEIRLRQEPAGRLRSLLALLSASNVVEEVDHMGRWSDRLGRLVALLSSGVCLLALLVGLICLHVIGMTIRLAIHARRDEIVISRLVGATSSFVRGPFMIEGALQGLIGAAAAGGGLYLLHHLAAPTIEHTLAGALSPVALSFLTLPQLGAGLAAGAMLGLLGSRLAIGRYLDA